MADFIDLAQSHHSIRAFTDEPVGDADLRRAVEAGQAASTSGAIQSYCAIRITDAAVRARLVELTGGQPYVASAGAFLVICGDTRRHRLVARERGVPYAARLEGFLLAVIDATLFAQNLVLAMESMGYGACYIGGLRNSLPAVDRLLDLPAGVYPLYGVCLGRPAQAPLARPRLDPRAVFFDDTYPDDAAMLDLVAEYDARYERYLAERGAEPRSWSAVMAKKFREPRRADLAAFYAEKGADLS